MSDQTPAQIAQAEADYSAKDIEVLEGLEPVRLRPGMYIGGTDSNAMHHLVAEILDNSMDEAVAGYADKIEVTLEPDNTVIISDNGRGIPIDPHPKFPEKSALEVILCTLHAGGKFSNKAYNTSGGLHGVGSSVVNALAKRMDVEVARNGMIYKQCFSKGKVMTPVHELGTNARRKGTRVTFVPDEEIFGDQQFNAKRIREMVRSKAYLFRGVTIKWTDSTAKEKIQETFHYPEGLKDYLKDKLGESPCITDDLFADIAPIHNDGKEVGKVEWAIGWPMHETGLLQSYVNTVPTPQGGTHETGMRAALTKAVKQYGDMRGKKADKITADDLLGGAQILLSAFIPDPQFQGQTKDKLTTTSTARQVENAMKDNFDLWLAGNTESADCLLNAAIDRAEERMRRKKELEVKRKTAVSRKLRLPGKLSDCSEKSAVDTEIFLVEGDSAGGSAKQARDRKTQAILPLRGKILNVASSTKDKMNNNNEIKDLIMALGCGKGKDFKVDDLRYERVIIMTDADVDGAHIATLLMTFFFQEMPDLVLKGHLYLAMPPLYKLSYNGKTVYVLDDEEKDHHLATTFKGKKNVELSRFKGLGEMLPAQLKETTMLKENRKLLKVNVESVAEAKNIVSRLMGKDPAERLHFIREHATEAIMDL